MFGRTIAAASALGLVIAPAALLANPAISEPVSVTIKVDDLDPAKANDRARFELRLKSAARSICRSGSSESWARASEQRCVEDVIASGANWAN